MTMAPAVRGPEAKLSPLERLEVLCDPDSLHLLRTDVRSRRMGDKARPGDGVLGATGRVDGRPVACFAQDASFAGGSLGEAHADTVVSVLALAERTLVPVIGFVESAGARMQEGLAALSGYGRIFNHHVALSGRVPQISVICGASAGGGSYAPALTDFVIMTESASMFLTGPGVVAAVTGEDVTALELGGPRVHERNGVCHLVAPTDVDAALLARDLLDFLHRTARRRRRCGQRWIRLPWRPINSCQRRSARSTTSAMSPVRCSTAAVCSRSRRATRATSSARLVALRGARSESSPTSRATSAVSSTAMRRKSGTLRADLQPVPHSTARARRHAWLPAGNQAGAARRHPSRREARARIRGVHCPRVTVLIRKAFGGAFIAMNAKELGADFVYAWPSAQLGVMGALQAVDIINRREIQSADDPASARVELAASYAAEHLHPGAASAEGYWDDVIQPAETRERVSAAFLALDSVPPRRRPLGNIPL